MDFSVPEIKEASEAKILVIDKLITKGIRRNNLSEQQANIINLKPHKYMQVCIFLPVLLCGHSQCDS